MIEDMDVGKIPKYDEVVIFRTQHYEFKQPWTWYFKYLPEENFFEMFDSDVGISVFAESREKCMWGLEEELEDWVFMFIAFQLDEISVPSLDSFEKIEGFIDMKLIIENCLKDYKPSKYNDKLPTVVLDSGDTIIGLGIDRDSAENNAYYQSGAPMKYGDYNIWIENEQPRIVNISKKAYDVLIQKL